MPRRGLGADLEGDRGLAPAALEGDAGRVAVVVEAGKIVPLQGGVGAVGNTGDSLDGQGEIIGAGSKEHCAHQQQRG